ncbi:hypothetical protein GCM10010428_29220 [Actinosynnema pretiosum subsp. pretiosum]
MLVQVSAPGCWYADVPRNGGMGDRKGGKGCPNRRARPVALVVRTTARAIGRAATARFVRFRDGRENPARGDSTAPGAPKTISCGESCRKTARACRGLDSLTRAARAARTDARTTRSRGATPAGGGLA